MEFIAHRGYWKSANERNSLVAFERAFSMGFGVETDVRDLDGVAVISHDPPSKGAIPFEEFVALYKKIGSHTCLSLNIKSDGINALIKSDLVRHDVTNYFCFDMSVPDSLRYFSSDLRVYTRRSEYEAPSELDAKAQGVWLDAFVEPFVPVNQILRCQQERNNYCLVSPELHNKPYAEAWDLWRQVIDSDSSIVPAICTDEPEAAARYFLGRSV